MNSLLRGQSSSKLISQRSQTRSTSYFSSKLKNSSNDAHAGRMGHQCGGRLEIQAGDKPIGRTSWLWWFATHDVISAKWWLYSYSSVFKSNYSDQSKFNFDKKVIFHKLERNWKDKKNMTSYRWVTGLCNRIFQMGRLKELKSSLNLMIVLEITSRFLEN